MGQKGRGAAADNSRLNSYRIAMLLRIPEVAAVRCGPPDNRFRVRFLIQGDAADDQLRVAAARVEESLAVLAGMEGRPLQALGVSWWREADGLATVELLRDSGTLTIEEVFLAAEVLREQVGPQLVTDGGDPWLVEEETAAQQEAIFALLRDMERGKARGDLVAIRSDGRVHVYRS